MQHVRVLQLKLRGDSPNFCWDGALLAVFEEPADLDRLFWGSELSYWSGDGFVREWQ